MAAEGILANGVTEILKGLSILVAKEISLALGVKDELQNLKKTLDMILAVMDDAEKKQVKSEGVRKWLEELKDIAYEAEDILDEHAYEVIRQRQMTSKRDKVRNFVSSSNPNVFRLKIAHEIKNINKKFNDVAKRKESLGLQIIELAGMSSHTINVDESSKLRERRETDSIVDQSLKIIGRDKDKSNIINMLLHNKNDDIQVIPIIGMGGLGKTTLAQSIFNDDTVKRHFDLKMWVCVSDDFVVKKLFMKIIESITDKKCDDVSNIDIIVRQLEKHLSGKKYLLVLDDVWNKNREEWVRLRRPLLVGDNGSKIIVTTRSDSVASIMDGGLFSYKLGVLDKAESWSLFHERTFGYFGGAADTPAMTAIGKELVEKCGGLPLALIFLISLLRSKNENEWRVINENKIWDQSFDEDETRILPILKLSYDHLPFRLKQCFSSFFPLYSKNTKFFFDEMSKLWMAEGFLLQQPEGNNISMEEVGNKYFNILLCNSFFQDLRIDSRTDQVISFKMHDLVHDLAKYVAGDRECLVLAAHENIETIPNVRRLRLTDFNQGMSKTVCKVLQDKTKLRALFVDGTVKVIDDVFDDLKRLRVLSLGGAPDIEAIPSSLTSNLKHLRFLEIASTKITSLPKSITRLFHLQTLNLVYCVNLKEFPKGIEKLINLRHLVLPRDINLPREVGQLTGLRTLEPIHVGDSCNKDNGGGGGCGIEVLKGLNLLSKGVGISYLRNVRSGINAKQANLKEKKHLNNISLDWRNDSNEGTAAEEYDKDEAVLEALQPHPNLKSLRIDEYFGARLPWWMGDPFCLPNLVELILISCRKCKQLVGFGKLPSLKVITLFEMGSLEEWVDVPSPTVPTVGVSSYSSCFPRLEKIYINRCPNLRITPTRFPSLKKLTLNNINAKVVVPIVKTNINSLCLVDLVNILEFTFLPLCLLQDSPLVNLNISSCLDFQGFLPNEKEEEGFTTSLERLVLLRLPNLKFLPDIRSFTSLKTLVIEDCESFKPLPEDITCLPTSLKHLEVVHIQNVKEVEDFKRYK